MSTLTSPTSRPAGWYGTLVLIATETALFGTLIASDLYLRFRTPAWPPAGIGPPGATTPALLAAILVLTSVPMALAARAATAGRQRRAIVLIAAAAVVQAAYLVVQVHLYAGDLSRFSPTWNAYGSIYFTLLAVHHAHVGLGVLADVWLVARLARGMTAYRRTAVTAVALYWHFVNLAGIAVTATILSAAW
jgi:heme/copper-type cytochrome/quinol oxidase subunit 3